VHYVPKSQVVYLDWPVEEGLKVIVSGGVVQPPGRGGMATAPPTSQPGRAIVPPAPAAPVVAAPAAPAADVPSPAAGGSSGTGA
jgi:hypothetical protein